MYTYQDLLKITDTGNERRKMEFTRSVIYDHKRSELYLNAILANEYDRRRNRTILQYQKLLYTMSGEAVPDNFSANYKMCSNFFDFFILQENQYLLGNGVTWKSDSTADKLGTNFSTQLQKLGKKALIEGESFGFWNLDHLEIFGVSEFCPLYDEENGALMAGVRFWQIDSTKPLRATLYELDGYTEYIWRENGGEILQPKRSYIVKVSQSAIDGTEIFDDGENYPTFPIVPLWGSQKKQSEIVGLQENIDAYDLIKSGFANDLDDASQIYWILKNAGGMDETDLVSFINRLKRNKAVNLEDGIEAEAHTIEVPYNARETLLQRLRDDLFEHAMAFDPKKLASGGSVVTAAIKMAYDPLDKKTDEYEYCVHEFIDNLLQVVGIIDEKATFTRSMITNESNQIQTLISAANYLPSDYVTRKVLTILGDGDLADDIIAEMESEEQERMQMAVNISNGNGANAGDEEDTEENEENESEEESVEEE